jgi:hypothetical protein
MPPLPKKTVDTRPRTRANRTVGKIWLGVLFVFLGFMNVANSTIEPMLGSQAQLLQAALVVSSVWNGILLASIGFGHGWARYTLVGFLFSFVIGQILFVVNTSAQNPNLNGEPIRLLAILFAANIFAGIFLLYSADIRQLAHHVID